MTQPGADELVAAQRNTWGPGDFEIVAADDMDAETRDRVLALAEMRFADEMRAMDDNQLKRYWTTGEGLKRWRFKPHPWTTLRNLLRKHVGPGRAERMASEWFHVVFGYWPGARKGANPVGNEPGTRARAEVRRRPYPGQRYRHGWIPVAGNVGAVDALEVTAEQAGLPSADSLGDESVATEILSYHYNGARGLPSGVEYLGKGKHRSVYVDHDHDVVYKIGDESAQRHEHRVLTEHAGEPSVPTVRMMQVPLIELDGHLPDAPDEDHLVIVMPYLPDDGSVPHEGMISTIADDWNPANLVAHGGHLWLVDAGGM